MRPTPTRSQSARVLTGVVAWILSFASLAHPQDVAAVGGGSGAAPSIRVSLERQLRAPLVLRSGNFGSVKKLAQAVQAPPAKKERSAGRKVLGGFLGAVGGFVVGALVGAAIDSDCGCDDPHLKGMLIGAPIGFVVGGVVGVAVASR